jgi:hypothetical protein
MRLAPHWLVETYTRLGQATPFAASCIRGRSRRERPGVHVYIQKFYLTGHGLCTSAALRLHDDAGIDLLQESTSCKHGTQHRGLGELTSVVMQVGKHCGEACA